MITMGAPAVRRTTKITLDPITIEGKAPPKGFDWRALPWKWIVPVVLLGGAFYLSKRKKGRGPLGA